MRGRYSDEERKKLVDLWKKYQNFSAVRRHFSLKCRPDNRTIKRIVAECRRGESHKKKGQGPKSKRVLTAMKLTEIRKSVKKDPKMGCRKRSAKLGMSRSSCARGLKECGYRVYHARTRLDLKAGTIAERLRCAKHFLALMNKNANFEGSLCFTDEKFFRLGGELNQHNMVYYSDVNPDYKIPKGNHYAGVMTWCAVTSKGLIGPFFPEGRIDATAYQNMLETEFLPKLRQYMDPRHTWFQQDGARPHTAATTVAFLNRHFGKNWIGKGGKHVWPAGSPDLTVCDYWLWNRLLEHVNSCTTTTREQMKNAIRAACRGVAVRECKTAISGFRRRLEECVANKGDEVRKK